MGRFCSRRLLRWFWLLTRGRRCWNLIWRLWLIARRPLSCQLQSPMGRIKITRRISQLSSKPTNSCNSSPLNWQSTSSMDQTSWSSPVTTWSRICTSAAVSSVWSSATTTSTWFQGGRQRLWFWSCLFPCRRSRKLSSSDPIGRYTTPHLSRSSSRTEWFGLWSNDWWIALHRWNVPPKNIDS